MLREVKEEIGLSAQKKDVDFFKIIKWQGNFRQIKNNEFYYVYLYRYDGNITGLKLQKEEVEMIKFVPIAEIEEGLKNHPEKYTPNGNNYWFEAIVQVKRKLNIS